MIVLEVELVSDMSLANVCIRAGFATGAARSSSSFGAVVMMMGRVCFVLVADFR